MITLIVSALFASIVILCHKWDKEDRVKNNDEDRPPFFNI